MIDRIRLSAAALESKSDSEIRTCSLELAYHAMTASPRKPPSNRLVARAFPLVVEGVRRRLGMRLHDVQLRGALQLAAGRIAEMKTGEGKTLTALLPLYLHGLSGRGTHLVTANDYLAERDCGWGQPVWDLLGLKAGFLTGASDPDQRRTAYRADVTYLAAKEAGFDFLRDRLQLLQRAMDLRDAPLQRPFNFALIDECDNVLIDEARTPLIIGLTNPARDIAWRKCVYWGAEHVDQFRESVDYRYEHAPGRVTLTSAGRWLVRCLPQIRETAGVPLRRLYDVLENAIKVKRDFARDQHYAVIDGDIVIIDEFSGRPAEGRQWQKGIHQAVQAREGLEVSPTTRKGAMITIQKLFSQYPFLAGMTGTAWAARKELKRVFKKAVVQIPCHRAVQRTGLRPIIVRTHNEKYEAIAYETARMIGVGRAVLIGTRSVEKSEALSACLAKKGVAHQVLNASHLQREAEIIGNAGRAGSVTVATNMAGRGTDIKLEASVRLAGGLHVILSELHESERIDWQLIGRGARQGDPGTCRVFVSLEDDILTVAFTPRIADRIRDRWTNSKSLPPRLFQVFHAAQRRLQNRHLVDRMILLRSSRDRDELLVDAGLDPVLAAMGNS